MVMLLSPGRWWVRGRARAVLKQCLSPRLALALVSLCAGERRPPARGGGEGHHLRPRAHAAPHRRGRSRRRLRVRAQVQEVRL